MSQLPDRMAKADDRAKRGRPVVRISSARIVALFHMPQPQAARCLGVSLSALKKVCRKHAISRWPYKRSWYMHSSSHDNGASSQRSSPSSGADTSAHSPPILASESSRHDAQPAQRAAHAGQQGERSSTGSSLFPVLTREALDLLTDGSQASRPADTAHHQPFRSQCDARGEPTRSSASTMQRDGQTPSSSEADTDNMTDNEYQDSGGEETTPDLLDMLAATDFDRVLYNLGRGSSKAVVEELALNATAFLDSVPVCAIPSPFEVCHGSKAEMIS
jgi:hypothetical protein